MRWRGSAPTCSAEQALRLQFPNEVFFALRRLHHRERLIFIILICGGWVRTVPRPFRPIGGSQENRFHGTCKSRIR